MQPHTDTQTSSIYSSDTLVSLHRLANVTIIGSMAQDMHSHLRRRLRQVKHPVRDLLGRALAEVSAPSAGAERESSINLQCVAAWILSRRAQLRLPEPSLLGNSTRPVPELCLWGFQKWGLRSGYHSLFGMEVFRTSQKAEKRQKALYFLAKVLHQHSYHKPFKQSFVL